MNVVGIDVAKGKSMVCIMKHTENNDARPFELNHDKDSFRTLEALIKELPGETRVVMESTARYHIHLADFLTFAGFFVSVVNSTLINHFRDDDLRCVKTDKADAIKICRYGFSHWHKLRRYKSVAEERELLKELSHQHEAFISMQTEMNNQLLSLCDIYFPCINELLSSRRADGGRKWVDFIHQFHSAQDVASMKESLFLKKYESFCKKYGYRYLEEKGNELYRTAANVSGTRKTIEAARLMLETLAKQLQEINRTVEALSVQMDKIAAMLPEYGIVMNMYGVGKKLGPQLIAEIGDVSRFNSKKALVAFAGIDPPPHESGATINKRKHITKHGSPHLRKTLFVIVSMYIKTNAVDQELYQYVEKKMSEGKHYYVCMIAGANKFLRQYYSIVTNFLDSTVVG